jgi:hypothetical protein
VGEYSFLRVSRSKIIFFYPPVNKLTDKFKTACLVKVPVAGNESFKEIFSLYERLILLVVSNIPYL